MACASLIKCSESTILLLGGVSNEEAGNDILKVDLKEKICEKIGVLGDMRTH